MGTTAILTKADLRRAVIRTAARSHWKHDRTGARVIACGLQDNDGWASERDRASMISFARQQASALLGPLHPLFRSGAGTTPCSAAPERTLPCEAHSPQRSAPAGTAAFAASRSRASGPKTDAAAVPALCSHSLHNGDNSHA